MSASSPRPAADSTYYVAAVMPESGRVEDGDPFPLLAADEFTD